MTAIMANSIPDPVAEMLGTGYRRFDTGTVQGLAKVTGVTTLEVLAVFTQTPGTGQFRDFIQQCKAEYPIVYLWEDWNPMLGPVMQRYGFQRCSRTENGETIHGWKWNAGNEMGLVIR